MDSHQPEHGRHALVVGFLAGTCVGAGLAMWLAPRGASELGQRLSQSGRDLAQRASETVREASDRVSDVAEDLARKGQAVRDDLAGVVARGAHDVENYATAVISGRR